MRYVSSDEAVEHRLTWHWTKQKQTGLLDLIELLNVLQFKESQFIILCYSFFLSFTKDPIKLNFVLPYSCLFVSLTIVPCKFESKFTF